MKAYILFLVVNTLFETEVEVIRDDFTSMSACREEADMYGYMLDKAELIELGQYKLECVEVESEWST